jgi:hypothetical protein
MGTLERPAKAAQDGFRTPNRSLRTARTSRLQTLKNIVEPMRAWRAQLGGQSAAKELQLAGLELCRETFHEETP